MKKTIAALLTAAVAGSALAVFAACGTNEQGKGGFGGAGLSVEAGARDTYGVGAATTARLLAEGMARNASLSARAEEAPPQGAEAFEAYFGALDAFLHDDALRTAVTENPDEAYAFDYKLTVEGKQPDGSALMHVLYYSEEQVVSREEHDDGETEKTEAYRLTGVTVLDGVEYPMTGYRSVETEREGGESETSEEFWMRATHPEDADTYVQMDLETETEQEGGEHEAEREYVYSIRKDGRLVERTSIAFETEEEHGEQETEYTLCILKDGARSVYEVGKETRGGSEAIAVTYRLADGSFGRFAVKKTANGYEYTQLPYDDDLDDLDDDDDDDDDDDRRGRGAQRREGA